MVVLATGVLVGVGGRLGQSASPAPSPTGTPVPAQMITAACVKQLEPTTTALGDVETAVQGTPTFAAYQAAVSKARTARDKVASSTLDAPCLTLFARAQAVLGSYLEALNRWSSCNGTTGCTYASIESTLQGYWDTASTDLAAVRGSMP